MWYHATIKYGGKSTVFCLHATLLTQVWNKRRIKCEKQHTTLLTNMADEYLQ